MESENCVSFDKVTIEEIRFKDVTFGYNNKGLVFSSLNLSFKKGEITAIVGESGSGKSTLIHLIQGLYFLEKGNILLNEQDIKYISKSSLRNILAIIAHISSTELQHLLFFVLMQRNSAKKTESR